MDPLKWIDDELERLEREDLLRALPAPLRSPGPLLELDGRPLINFASNDYLGLAGDERLVAAAVAACRHEGVGRGASPLICGRAEHHVLLERRLAEFEGAEAALLFPSGFAANAGVIPALVDEGDAIYSDAKNHASIVDGCRLARADRHVYPHRDTQALAELLRRGDTYRRRLIVTDTIFSMDGDLAPLVELGKLADEFSAMLLVDEAHATGVFGDTGRGVVEHFAAQAPELCRQVHVRIGTLSKALGAAGGFVCGSQSLVTWLANRARSYVFSTAQPAAVSAAAVAALEIVDREPWRRIRVRELADRLCECLRAQHWNVGQSASQIVPIIVGSPAETMRLARALRERGFWVGGIRPPSVPANESLLRIGLSAAHSDQMLDGLVDALGALRGP